VCGIDIGKAGMVATIRVPSEKDPARRASETRSFGTTRREVLALADWLRCWQVPAVVMEATSVIRDSNGYEMDIGQVGSWRTPSATGGSKAASRRGPRRMAWAVGCPRDRRSPDNPSATGQGARKADRRLP